MAPCVRGKRRSLKQVFSPAFLGASGAWTLLLLAAFTWHYSETKEEMVTVARQIAMESARKDLLYRRWAANQGGVYVRVSEGCPPNPYLKVPERDVTTTSGVLVYLTLGAVLGLIHVMENLNDPSKLGGGIAVAFVATVYGVGTANLLYLPMGSKLKIRHQEEMLRYELILEGVCAIAEGENPRLIERKLSVYVHERKQGKTPEEANAAAAAQTAPG